MIARKTTRQSYAFVLRSFDTVQPDIRFVSKLFCLVGLLVNGNFGRIEDTKCCTYLYMSHELYEKWSPAFEGFLIGGCFVIRLQQPFTVTFNTLLRLPDEHYVLSGLVDFFSIIYLFKFKICEMSVIKVRS